MWREKVKEREKGKKDAEMEEEDGEDQGNCVWSWRSPQYLAEDEVHSKGAFVEASHGYAQEESMDKYLIKNPVTNSDLV